MWLGPSWAQSMLTRAPQGWYNHTRDIYRWLYSRLRYWGLQDFSVSQTQRRVNAFNMSWTISRFAWVSCDLPHFARRGLHECIHKDVSFNGISQEVIVQLQRYAFLLTCANKSFFFLCILTIRCPSLKIEVWFSRRLEVLDFERLQSVGLTIIRQFEDNPTENWP